MSSADGPLAWLPAAQNAERTSIELWDPLEERLPTALADLRESTFVICQIPGPQDADGSHGAKYLQFLLADVGSTRVLRAEASSLRHQGVPDPAAMAQQALIDAMGWTRPSDGNHRRDYPWPLAVDEVVADSLRILRDVWRIAHPSQVRIGDPQVMGEPSSVLPSANDEQMLAALASWVQALGVQPETEHNIDGWLLVDFDGIPVMLGAFSEEGRLSLTALLGDLASDADSVAALVESVADDAFVGKIERLPMDEGGWSVSLSLELPVDGLTAKAFGQNLGWLVTSTRAVRARLLAQGRLAS